MTFRSTQRAHRLSNGIRRIGSCLAVVGAILTISACVRNSVEEIPLSDVNETVYDTAVVIIGIGAEAGIEDRPVSLTVDRRAPSTMLLDATCWVYDRIQISAQPPSEGVRYFAFRVPSSLYGPSIMSGLRPPPYHNVRASRYAYFDASAGAVLYLGDVLRTKRTGEFKGSSYTVLEQYIDTSEARVALARNALQPAVAYLSVADWKQTDVNPGFLLCVP